MVLTVTKDAQPLTPLCRLLPCVASCRGQGAGHVRAVLKCLAVREAGYNGRAQGRVEAARGWLLLGLWWWCMETEG